MSKNSRYGMTAIALALSLCSVAAHAINASSCIGQSASNQVCDVSFTTIPTFQNLCLATIESGIYTITNNTPVTLTINYIRIQNNDAFPSAATSIVAAPTNNCGTSLAPGASCNIQLNLQPLTLGTFDRVLQIGINTRQVQLKAPAITAAVNCTPTGPTPPPTGPTIPGTPPSLFSASILGATTVTNTGLSIVNGDVDLSPIGSAVTGFPPGSIVNGIIHIEDGTANTAHANAQIYFAALNSLPCPPANNLTGQDLGGKTLLPGVYCFSSTAQLTGALTLSGPAGSSFVFQIGTALNTASNSSVILSGGVTNGNVNWAVGSSAVLGTGTAFQGIIDAGISITLNTGASLVGRAWALNGAVTLDTNLVNPNS